MRKHRLAAPKNNWVDIETIFIDQAELDERRSELRTADTHVFAGLRFQPVDLLGDIPADELRIPTNLLKSL